MASSNPIPVNPRPSDLTFGVELEFLVPYLGSGDADPHGDVAGLPPVIRVDPGESPKIIVTEILEKLFDKHGLPTRITPRMHKHTNFYVNNMIQHLGSWDITHDITLQEFEMNEYKWMSVEVRSPAERNISVAFDALEYARNLIISTYRTRVNLTCGLHVHVGSCAEFFPHGAVRRIAALSWATEHLLLTLCHPWRRANIYTETLRGNSRIASNNLDEEKDHSETQRDGLIVSDETEICAQYLATEVRHGERPISWRERNSEVNTQAMVDRFIHTREEGHYEPFDDPALPVDPAPPPYDGMSLAGFVAARVAKATEKVTQAREAGTAPAPAPERTRRTPRIKSPHYTADMLHALGPDDKRYAKSTLPLNTFVDQPKLGVWPGVARIYEAKSSCEIQWRLETSARGFVNFDGYRCDGFGAPMARRTIEFRGAEGTLTPWVETWAKIVVGLVRFAIHAPVDRFLQVIEMCDVAEREDGRYDVVDLLEDMGLFAEAVQAEQKIKDNLTAWGLEYVDGGEAPH